MADQKVTELPIKNQSAINVADYLFGIDAAEGYQMLISDLAKKIIEDFTGSTLGGSSQALKTIIDAINTKIGNTAMGTTATTITGAIKEHETDISTLNGNTSANIVTNIQTFAEAMPTGSFRFIRLDADSYTGTDLDGINQYYKAGTGFIIKRNANSIRVVVFNGGSGINPVIMRLKNSQGWQAWQTFDGTNL